MNFQEALNVFGLTGEITEQTIKTAFKKLAIKYHPDRNPAGAEMMKMINAAYDFMCANLEKFAGYQHTDNAYDYGDLVNQVLNKLHMLDGLTLEILGNWIWISGNTKDNKEALKELGCLYAFKKKMWYFRPEEHRCVGNRRNNSIEEIREKYGTSGTMKSHGKSVLEMRA